MGLTPLPVSSAALSTTIERVAVPRNEQAIYPPRIVTLIGGQEDETPAATLGTVAADTVNVAVGAQGWKLTVPAAQGGKVYLDPVGTSDPLVLPPVSAVGLRIYLPDATKITSVSVELYGDAALTSPMKWVRSNVQAGTTLVNGWNVVRWEGHASTLATFDTLYRAQVLVTTNAATDATVGHLWVECPQKASIVIVNDWGSKRFFELGYPALKARGIPVTWALRPNKMGTGTAPDDHVTWADVATLAAENNNSIGIHSFDGDATSAMTAAQLRADYLKAVKALQAKGYRTPLWRPAVVQNLATNATALDNLMVARATSTDSTNIAPWPPINRYNIPRIPIGHSGGTAQLDTYFANLQDTHEAAVFYAHGIDASGGNHTTPSQWAHFLGKLDDGLAGGWLECVTFEQLYARSGGRVRSTFGDHVAEFTNAAGVATTMRLP